MCDWCAVKLLGGIRLWEHEVLLSSCLAWQGLLSHSVVKLLGGRVQSLDGVVKLVGIERCSCCEQ